MLNKTDPEILSGWTSAECGLRDCATPGGTSGIDAANPVSNLLFTRHTSKPAQDLLRRVLNVDFMVFSKDGATASLDPHGSQKGSLTQDYVNFPTLKFGMFLPFLPSSPVTLVDATDRKSYLIGHPSCHPIYWMFQFDWSSQNLPGKHLLCWSTSSHPQMGFFVHSSSDQAQGHDHLCFPFITPVTLPITLTASRPAFSQCCVWLVRFPGRG